MAQHAQHRAKHLTASHSISHHHVQAWPCLHLSFSSQRVQAGRCVVTASAAMVASAYKFVTWDTGIQKFIVQVASTKRRKRRYKSFATEGQAVKYLVRLTRKPRTHLLRQPREPHTAHASLVSLQVHCMAPWEPKVACAT